MTKRITLWIFLMIGIGLAQIAFGATAISAMQGATISLVDVLVNISTFISIICIVGAVVYGVNGNIIGAMLSIGVAITATLAPSILKSLFEAGTQIPEKVVEANKQSADGTMFMYLGLFFAIGLAIIAIRAASSIRSQREESDDYFFEEITRRVSVPDEPEIPSIGQLQGVPELPQERNADVAVERNKRKIVL